MYNCIKREISESVIFQKSLSARNSSKVKPFSQRAPRLPASLSLIIFHFEALVLSLSDMHSAQRLFLARICSWLAVRIKINNLRGTNVLDTRIISVTFLYSSRAISGLIFRQTKLFVGLNFRHFYPTKNFVQSLFLLHITNINASAQSI